MQTPGDGTDKRLIDSRKLLTAFAETEILKNASKLTCECPKHLLFLLNKVRSFQEYELGCINDSVDDRATHEWLHQQSLEMDRLITSVIIELARREKMIDSDNVIVPHPKR